MHIIFGDAIKHIPNSYTVLELDTIRIEPDNQEFKTYCVIEKIPLAEFPVAEINQKVHADLIGHYKQQDWQFCEDAISVLYGKWDGEIDSFYDDLSRRINQYKQTAPDSSWDGTLVRSINTQ